MGRSPRLVRGQPHTAVCLAPSGVGQVDDRQQAGAKILLETQESSRRPTNADAHDNAPRDDPAPPAVEIVSIAWNPRAAALGTPALEQAFATSTRSLGAAGSRTANTTRSPAAQYAKRSATGPCRATVGRDTSSAAEIAAIEVPLNHLLRQRTRPGVQDSARENRNKKKHCTSRLRRRGRVSRADPGTASTGWCSGRRCARREPDRPFSGRTAVALRVCASGRRPDGDLVGYYQRGRSG